LSRIFFDAPAFVAEPSRDHNLRSGAGAAVLLIDEAEVLH
jgi:hypothetical protein